MTRKQVKNNRWQAYKPLIVTALAVAGAFNVVSAVVAEGTLAGTEIRNTASGTYSDGNGNNINAVSNTVTINVAKVAGLTVTSSGFNDPNSGSIVPGDTLTYDFLVTNTGNAPTYVFVPGANGITVTNGSTTRVDIIDVNGVPITPASIPQDGTTTENLAGLPSLGLIAPNGTFTVRVTVTAAVPPNSTGGFVGVQFGDTTDAGAQNQQNIPDGTTSRSNEARTLKEGTLIPVNGEREAAAFRQEAFNTAPITLAQALLLKTSTYSNSGTLANPADDTILYGLELRVGNESFPTTGVSPGKLEGTDIKLEGGIATNRILVSDAVPVNTVFDDRFLPVAPDGWIAVYSTDPAATTNPLQANWTATPPSPANIKRVGFIYNAAARGALAPLTTVTGFKFRVITSGLSAPGGIIANIAQVFGETEGDPGNNIVYDESGDQRFNNLDDGVTPTTKTTTFVPGTDFGIGNAADPEQTPNQNDGTGPKGESNIVRITVVPEADGNLFNGPNGAPSATGSTNNTNDDFTNASAGILSADLGPQGTLSDPNSVTITNQVQNPATATTRLDTVTLLPLAPSAALAAAGGSGNFGADGDLPSGTKVTIRFGGQSVEYEYTVTPGNPGSLTPTNPGSVPVLVGTLQPGEVKSYTVEIDLPANTGQIEGYGVPIVAFVENTTDGIFTPATEKVFNITIDRVYTGFMKLVKQARAIYAPRDGLTREETAFSSNTSGLDLTPGDTIEYLITYENISEVQPATGGGNIILNANSFVLTENGNIPTLGGNNWATFTNHRLGTTATAGIITYKDSTGPTYNVDPPDGTRVDIYTNSVGTVAPTEGGSLTFRRQIK